MAPSSSELPGRDARIGGEGIEVSSIRATLEGVLRDAGLSWAELEDRASEVVLFGSRASGVATAESDWDLLLVGRGRSLHTDAVDLIWVPPDRLCDPQWLGSELANHVVAYGVWLHGRGWWREYVFAAPGEIKRKQAALQFQLAELRHVWLAMLPGAQARHLRRLRRGMQRLRMLRSGLTVPPTAFLDQSWRKSGSPPEELELLLEEASNSATSASPF
jgi:hypothetical protein